MKDQQQCKMNKKIAMTKTIISQKHIEKGLHYLVIWIVQSHFSSFGVKLNCTRFTFSMCKKKVCDVEVAKVNANNFKTKGLFLF